MLSAVLTSLKNFEEDFETGSFAIRTINSCKHLYIYFLSQYFDPNITRLQSARLMSNPDYTTDWYEKISNIHLKDDILKEINEKCTPSYDTMPLFMTQILEFYQRIPY